MNPNYATAHQWYGDNLSALGRFDEAIAGGKRAQELDPLSLITNSDLGENYIYARQYDKAIEQYRKTIKLDQNWYVAHEYLGWAYELKGLLQEATLDEAFREIKRAEEIDPLSLVIINNVAEIYIHRGDLNSGYQGMPANDRPRS